MMPGEFEKLLQCGCPVTNLSVNEPPTWGKPVTIHDNQGFWGIIDPLNLQLPLLWRHCKHRPLPRDTLTDRSRVDWKSGVHLP